MLQRFFRPYGRGPAEICLYVDAPRGLSAAELEKLQWFLSLQGKAPVTTRSVYADSDVIEIGPPPSFATPFSSQVISVCEEIGVGVTRVEQSTRYPKHIYDRDVLLNDPTVYDPLTRRLYDGPLSTFDVSFAPSPVHTIPALEQGIDAFRIFNAMHQLGIDEQYMQYYYQLVLKMKRNFTDVELFQLANANSDHSRHLFWRALLVIDGVEMPFSLMDVVQRPWKRSPGPSVVAFKDNAGAIFGHTVLDHMPINPGKPTSFEILERTLLIIITAESHNFPTHVSPFEGATTGPGGRIRDILAFGRGGRIGLAVVGYFTGNLHIHDYRIPGEVIGGDVNPDFAMPLPIMVKGSNGASSYQNLFGEPFGVGFRRTFGQMVGEVRYEARKCVLFSGAGGVSDAQHAHKEDAEVGMLIVGLGGPAYPIGFGGGAASSGAEGGKKTNQNAVQRGDPQVENCVYRALISCMDLGRDNPIAAIHDQGAGGPANVLTELVEKIGGTLDLRKIKRGDKSMSTVQVWICEYQERFGLLVRPEKLALFQMICAREGVNCEVVGTVTGSGRIVVYDSDTTTPVNLDLAEVLTDLPRQRYDLTRLKQDLKPFVLPAGLTIDQAAELVLKLPSVGSKSDLVYKIDGSVGGLVVRQSCCGPLNLPVGNVGVVAHSYLSTTGFSIALGEQPIVGLIDAAAGARTSIGEALTNFRAGGTYALEDIAFQANWMCAVKAPGEGARLWDAANGMADLMEVLPTRGIQGKDSSSLKTPVGNTIAITPMQLVATAIAACPDVRESITPDLKGSGNLIGYLDMGKGKMRMGGSALAQALNQLGDECPDIDGETLVTGFNAIGELMERGVLLSLHDVSDGGLYTTLLEMLVSGNRGAQFVLPDGRDPIRFLFNQELGFAFEYAVKDSRAVHDALAAFGEHFHVLGESGRKSLIFENRRMLIDQASVTLSDRSIATLRQLWEETAMRLLEETTGIEQVNQERESHKGDCELRYRLSFTPRPSPAILTRRPKVAIVRDKGTNGEREMRAAFIAAGFDAVDICMEDFLNGSVTSLRGFVGMVLCGGFSRSDVIESARGWAAIILFNERVNEIFTEFYERDDTFVFGVCNGCQLMGQLGWLPKPPRTSSPYLAHNKSGRFEHRSVGIMFGESSCIFLTGMAGSIVPIPSAHGEGNHTFDDPATLEYVESEGLAPVRYVDPTGNPTEMYPFNPNGSPHGIAGLVSKNNRCFALMPHPERVFRIESMPYVPPQWRDLRAAPLLRMFQNAYAFCA